MFRERKNPVFAFIAFALIYMFVLTTAVELGHNNIFRKQIDPLLFAGAAMLMTRLWLHFRPAGESEKKGREAIYGYNFPGKSF
jgi:hypothetical protein